MKKRKISCLLIVTMILSVLSGMQPGQPADHKDTRPSGMDSQERGVVSLQTENAERIMAEAGLVFLVLVLCAPK